MKASPLPNLAPFILKLAGIVLILLYIVDLLVLLLFAKFQDSQWLLAFTTQLIDRGFVPLLGLALLFAGLWAEQNAEGGKPDGSRGLRLAALFLSSFLGLLFLLLAPLHVNTTRTASDDQMKQISQEATKAEGQLESQVQQLRTQLDTQLASIDQVIKSGQLQGDQLNQAQKQQEQLKKLKADPKALEAQIGPSRSQEQERIRGRKQELETQVRENSLRSGLRAGLASLILAVAHAAIGWTGLRRL
ncbi:MAG TPA: HpsJ family protein [Thermosynechococcaceae cyanobacterium]